jgi:hypothetical protein
VYQEIHDTKLKFKREKRGNQEREMFCENQSKEKAISMIRKPQEFAHRKICLMILLISQGRIIRTPPKLVW